MNFIGNASKILQKKNYISLQNEQYLQKILNNWQKNALKLVITDIKLKINAFNCRSIKFHAFITAKGNFYVQKLSRFVTLLLKFRIANCTIKFQQFLGNLP